MTEIALALGGGSAKGCAHAGVIQALEDNNIAINMVSGTSIGALIGAVYASGTLKELVDFSKKITWQQILKHLDLTFPRQGIMSGKRIEAFLQEYLPYKNIEDLPIPFTAIATDISTGKEVRFEKGPLIQAVRASISLPVIFTPIEHQNRFLADGGLVNPLPINVLREKNAEKIIAVDLNFGENRLDQPKNTSEKEAHNDSFFEHLQNHYQELTEPMRKKIREWIKADEPALFDVLGWSVNIMQEQITQENLRLHPADIVIRPNLGHIRGIDFHKAEEMMAIGYEATEKALNNAV